MVWFCSSLDLFLYFFNLCLILINFFLVTDDQRPFSYCKARCGERCKLSSRPNLCHRACGTCCARCSCVPPGTYGNYEVCPCYANMTTHGGRKKCP
ncbi:hypothetical protein DCAR_0519121 [Daucus carota subsp. sativus]|uniref:Gibberellin regulated protein n=1 Tax=Daucus carota subsp. sativus TaxID=79200 RepID=A0AAF1B116_DAUCS|nr:hypothetical protein DCAR_0519121 [Daucus carota subsp. sativus]